MSNSVLEAIKMGFWDFEPEAMNISAYDATDAVPGSFNKLQVLAERIAAGEPLWHPYDRSDCEGMEQSDLRR